MKIGRKESRGIASVRLASQAIADLKYKSLFENSGTAIVIIDKDGIYHLVNSRAAKHFGGDVDDIVGKSIFDFLPQEGAQKYLERNQKVIESGIGEEYEYTFELPTGTKTLLITDQVLIDGRGIGYALQSSSIDITARKQAEEALKESESNYRLLAGNLPGTSVFLFDHDLRFILAEGFLHPEFGFTTSNMEGKTLWEVLPPERADRLAPIYKDALEGKPTENLISEYKGHIYLGNILPVKNRKGKIIAGMVVSQDITDIKKTENALLESEQRYRLLFENASEAFLLTNPSDGSVYSANPAACAMFGQTKEEITGVGRESIIDMTDPRLALALEERRRTGKFSGELTGVRKGGTKFPIEVSSTIFSDNKGNLRSSMIIKDISARKEAEDIIRKSEEKWHLLVDTIPDYIALYDAEGKYLFLNHFAEGFSAKDIEGKTYADFLTEESKKLYDETFRKAKETKETQYNEYTAFGDNYSIQNYESFFVPIFENDILVNMLVIARDITQRKDAERLLVESEANARAIMESTSDTMLLLDKDGTVIDNNEGHASRLGFARKDLLGEKIYDYLPEDIEKKRKELIDLAISTGVTQYGEDVRAERSIEYSVHPIFDRNKITDRVAIFVRDITESKNNLEALKKNEELLSLFMKHSPIYSFIKEVTPTESRVLRASENYTDMIGISGSDMVGKTMYELFPLEFAKKITDDDWAIFSGGKSMTLNEELNGRYYVTIKFPITQNGKNLLAGYTIDVTDQKLAEQCLLENESRLQELNATKDKFFSIIAHDLKSPFNSIIGFSNLLIRQIEEKDYAAIERYASIIQSSSQQAMDLLMNLLEWSRAQTGHIVFTPEKIDFAASINQVTELLFAFAQQKSITIYSETSVNLSFFADKAMINTILRNLISNAIKFTNVGGEIIISAKQMLNDLVVSVSDNGIGMDEETTSKLFRIDQHHSTLGTEKEKGTGLGLLLCKEFIEKHGGRIWVESEPRKGSKFHFSIPYRTSASSSF